MTIAPTEIDPGRIIMYCIAFPKHISIPLPTHYFPTHGVRMVNLTQRHAILCHLASKPQSVSAAECIKVG